MNGPKPPKINTYEEELRSIVRESATLTDRAKDHAVEKVWAYVRENCESLDSERACRMIRLIVDYATVEISVRLDEITLGMVKAKAAAKELRRQVKALSAASADDIEADAKEAEEL